jgi:PTS system N-acetylglucosamine-specific IIC component
LRTLLYLIHAILTGVSMALMDLLDVQLGFGFSAGLIDYVLNYGKATNPLLLLPVGAAYCGDLLRAVPLPASASSTSRRRAARTSRGRSGSGRKRACGPRGQAILAALGGVANLAAVEACTTRLRLIVADFSRS